MIHLRKKDENSVFGFGKNNKIQLNKIYLLDFELNLQGENISTNISFNIFYIILNRYLSYKY